MLDRGNIVRAERTYRLLLQFRPGGRPMDVRQHNMWAIGAEILMRAGEKPPRSQDTNGSPADRAGDEEQSHSSRAPIPHSGFFIPARWGSSANINGVKAYFEALIQQYPYDHKFPSSVSAPDFQLAMLGCEIYNVHAECTTGLARAEKGAGTWHGRRLAERPDKAAPGRQSETLKHPDRDDEEQEEDGRQAKVEVRMRALVTMEDITRRMDVLMQALPYRKNDDFLRLRATASLYAADLLMTTPQMTSSERNETERRRQLQQRAAVDTLEKLVHNGGELDGTTQLMLGAWSENEGDLSSPPSLHSSLPIRRIQGMTWSEPT
ncbi:hypothetical protein HRG_004898 [Hirsutella rhossiliensis]|uniref:Uncharacterized protein n=1 Tax=Hirsutella rhossiliensis TaxID=111463 RepID=A0A9P8N085_9HYPO|nr:uncharacterized protein HRG_04898 [Hirsutella rhossiliensis]KAH0964470.1 hypothetical protein HRG_04898 [Hirsutella rhossiliensis]